MMTQQSFEDAVAGGRWADLLKESFYRDASGNIFQRVAIATAQTSIGAATRGVQPDATVSGKIKLAAVGTDSAIDIELVPKGASGQLNVPIINQALINFKATKLNAEAAKNYKIATLPISASNTGDLLYLECQCGSTTSDQWHLLRIGMGNRSGFNASFTMERSGQYTPDPGVGIKAYQNVDGTTDVYASLNSTDEKIAVTAFASQALTGTPVVVYQNPTNVGTTPAGTLVFDSTTAEANSEIRAGSLKLSGGVRVTKVLTATQSFNFGSVLAGTSADVPITVTGAATGDQVLLGFPANISAQIVYTGYVSAADTVMVRAFNPTGSTIVTAAGTFRATVIKFV